MATVRFNSHAGEFVSGTNRYIYHGERLGLYTNNSSLLTSPIILIRAVFEDPFAIKDYSGLYTYGLDKFPIPLDMMATIRDLILSKDLRIKPETKEITINNDN
jgi:hypothetical protein